MRSLALLSFALGLTVAADEPIEKPLGRVAIGTYEDRFSDATGTWKGWSISGEWFRDRFGPWSGSVTRSQRPEGTGTTFMLAKEHGFGGNSWVWGGISSGTGADFLPQWRVDLDSNIDLGGPWGLAAGAAWSRFSDGYTMSMLQAGPSWTGEAWSASVRAQRLQYGGGGGSDLGYFADLRWGAHNLRRWHNVRLAWGRGIFDSLQSGGAVATGGTAAGTGSHSGQGRGRGGSAGTTLPGTEIPTEFLVSSASHVPINRNFALKAEVGWGKRDGQFNVWTGSLQFLCTF